MDRRNAIALVASLGGLAISGRLQAETARSSRQYRIGLLPDLNSEQLDWLLDSMKELGWLRGREFTFVQSGVKFGPHAEPNLSRMVIAPSQASQDGIPQNTQRLVARNPDLILATSTAYAVAAHRASGTIPVVMWTGGYPVEAGIANSLASPGKNVTGASIYAGTGVWGKLVELLRESKPTISRVGVLWDYLPPAFPQAEMEQCHREFRKAESILGVKVFVAEVAGIEQLPSALASLEKDKPDALIVTSGWGLLHARQRVMEYAMSKRLPVIVDFRWRSPVEPYPLLVYGASQHDLMRNAAQYVVKILQGARPGDLPVLQPTRFELLVNLRTAKAIDLSIPKSFLMRADRVVE